MSEALNALAVARRIAARLDEDGIPYGIGGALALAAWQSPRQTKDVDMSLFVREEELPRAFDSLDRAGLRFDHADAMRSVGRIGLFVAFAGKMRVDFFVSAHPHFDEMARRRVAIEDLDGGSLWFISAEDLTVMKLIYGRDKDVVDLTRLFATRTLDLAYVRHWLTQMIPADDRRLAILDDLARRFQP